MLNEKRQNIGIAFQILELHTNKTSAYKSVVRHKKIQFTTNRDS